MKFFSKWNFTPLYKFKLRIKRKSNLINNSFKIYNDLEIIKLKIYRKFIGNKVVGTLFLSKIQYSWFLRVCISPLFELHSVLEAVTLSISEWQLGTAVTPVSNFLVIRSMGMEQLSQKILWYPILITRLEI